MQNRNHTVIEMLNIVNDSLEELKAIEIKKIDVSSLTTITDYMVVCSGRSHRHVRAIADNLMKQLKSHSINLIGVSGTETGDWVLLDLADIIVHVMMPEIREYYDLEGLWGKPDIE